MYDGWPASRFDRLNSTVQVVITVLLNTSIVAECVCLALLSGSVLFDHSFTLVSYSFSSSRCSLARSLSLPYVDGVASVYKSTLLSIDDFFDESNIHLSRC